jgi:hypothetical protein
MNSTTQPLIITQRMTSLPRRMYTDHISYKTRNYSQYVHAAFGNKQPYCNMTARGNITFQWIRTQSIMCLSTTQCTHNTTWEALISLWAPMFSPKHNFALCVTFYITLSKPQLCYHLILHSQWKEGISDHTISENCWKSRKFCNSCRVIWVKHGLKAEVNCQLWSICTRWHQLTKVAYYHLYIHSMIPGTVIPIMDICNLM